MSNWREKGKKLSEGKWIRFDAANNVRIITFIGEPEVIEKTVSQGDRKGEKYEVLSFPVEVDGEDKILEPNRSLLKLLMDEDEDESIIGGTYRIKAIDAPTNKTWKINRVADNPLEESTKKKKKPEPEDDDDEEKEKAIEKAKAKEKAKFKKEVEKRTKARKAKKEEATEEEEHGEEDRASEGAGGEEKEQVE